MAKMFYTMEETKAALGKSEDDIRNLSREGKLREFRDGPRLMFKADQVDQLKAELGGEGAGDQIGLSAGDTHTPLGLMDSKTGSGSHAGLKGDTAAGAAAPSKEDTGAGIDVGLSGSLSGSMGGGSLAGSVGGSMGGMPSPGTSKGPSKPGVNVFGPNEVENVDPMAQTHITPAKDQISLEGVGSGSGLLDLTRETDDTSLGAALLDEISPGGSKKGTTSGGATPAPTAGSTAGLTSISQLELPAEHEATEPVITTAPVIVEVKDSMSPAFAGGSIGAALVILVGGLVLINAITNNDPLVDARFEFVKSLSAKNMAVFFVGGLVVTIVCFVVGILIGKLGNKQATA